MNLQAAIDAARTESGERSMGQRATRGRVLAAIERSPRRRLHAVVAAVIASMFGASAFAWYARTPHAARPAPPTMEVVAPATVVEPVVVAERSAVTINVPVPTVVDVPAVPAPPRPIAAPPIDARDASLELYATAHQLHFQAHDMTAALAAWDRYLAAAPQGTLVPEARFNRVVALVRLARWDDAEKAVGELDASFRSADVARLRELIRNHR